MNEAARKEMRSAAEIGVPVPREIAMEILLCGPDEIPEVLSCATLVRKRYFGDGLLMCSIMNAKSGACGEDCAFCAQSAHHRTKTEVSPLTPVEEIEATYLRAAELPVSHFGVVTSGKSLMGADIDMICGAARRTHDPRLAWCASLGCLDKDLWSKLKDAGFRRFHHNLETAESFFPNICTTHSYALRIDTVRAVKEVGLEICCGGILGLGESLEQRVEFAEILAREDVDSIPLNFLIPIAGTRLEFQEVMKPLDMIRSIAMFRLMNPGAEVKVCAGRVHLRDLQSMVFYAGATGIMIGDLLTVAGRNPEKDLRMIEDLGFRILQ
ncbi:MAG: biotin synthase BioB [Syntrophobacteraceae bacterium]